MEKRAQQVPTGSTRGSPASPAYSACRFRIARPLFGGVAAVRSAGAPDGF